MWDIYSFNFDLRGVGYSEVSSDIVKRYSKGGIIEGGKGKPLTNRGLIKLFDNFLPLKHGNVLHGSSEAAIKNLKTDADSAYPLVNESFYSLLCEFLDYKLKYGTPKEKEIYNGMSACDLVDRLLIKSCVSYYGRNENYLLKSGHKGQGDFSTVGTDKETAPLTMDNCLTRDEIKLSGFVWISSKVTKVIKDKSYTTVSIGIPFPCLNREGLFDFEDIMITRRQNIKEKGYGPINSDSSEELKAKIKYRSMWNTFYGNGCKCTEFTSMNRRSAISKRENMRRYLKLPHSVYVDLLKLVRRLSVITMGILAEANSRAKKEEKMAYIVIDKNKIGLGTCPDIYAELFLRNLSYELLCSYRYLNNVYGIHFVGFTEDSRMTNGLKMYLSDGVFGNQHPNEGIEIMYSQRHSELLMEKILQKKELLLIETYRLEANALPGNELWMGKVSKDYSHPSFDVRHTSIPFIHNAHLNRSRVCGNNLRTFNCYGTIAWPDTFAVKNN